MKILIVSARYYPEQFSIVNIAEEFVNQGHTVTVLTGKPNYGYWKILDGYENINSEIINGVNVIRVNEKARVHGILGLVKNYISIYFEYKKHLKKMEGDFDVVLSHVLSPIWTMAGIKKLTKRLNIPHIHYGLDLWPESLIATNYFKSRGLIFQFFKSYSKKLYKTCDYICFSSPSAEEYFRNYLKIKTIPFKQIYQPCLSAIPTDLEVKSHSYLKQDKIHILYCGTVARFHRLNLLIEALSLCENRFLFHLDIVGDGSELANVMSLVSKLELDELVAFHGRVSVEETKKFMLDSDVLYVPLAKNSKTSYLIPQKVTEYLMYGRPIFGFLVGDGKNLLNEASSKNVICEESVESLKNGLNTLLSFKVDDFIEIGTENRHYFLSKDRFKIKTICKELIDVMQSVKK